MAQTGSADRYAPPATNYGRVALFCARHAYAVLSIYLLAASVALAFAIVKLTVNTDPGGMIARHLDFRQSFADYVKTFPSLENTFVVVIDSKDPELGREAAKSLAQSFAARGELFEDVYAPGTSAFFDDYGILYLDPDEVRRIAEEIGKAGPILQALGSQPNLAGLAGLTSQLAQAGARGLVPPSIAPLFLEMTRTANAEADGKSRPLDWADLGGGTPKDTRTRWFVIAKPRLDFTKLDPAEAAIAEAKQIVADPEIRRQGKVSIALTGEAAVNAEEFEAVIEGASIAGLVSLLLVTLVIAIGLPALRLIVPALAMLVLGFMLTAGFAALAVGQLNMISVAFAVLFIGLGIDFAVHLLLRVAEYAKRATPLLPAIAMSADGTGPALALCTLTTSLAFLAFTPTDFAGMAQLGIIAAGGVVIAFVASLTLLPAVLALVPMPGKWRRVPLAPSISHNQDGMQHSTVRLFATLAITALAFGCVFTLSSARFDGDPINLKDPDSPTVIAFRDLLESDSSLAYAIQIIVEGPAEAEALTRKLQTLPLVDEVQTIADLLPQDQEAKLTALNALKEQLPKNPDNGSDIGHKQRLASLLGVVGDLETIEKTEGASAEVRTAARNLHLALLRIADANGSLVANLAALERALFAKLPETLSRLNHLAATGQVGLAQLEPEIRQKYIAGDGRWRVEVTGKGDMRNEADLRAFVQQVRGVAPQATGAPVEIAGAGDVVATAIRIACLAALGLVILVLVPLLRRLTDIALVIAPIAISALLLVGYTVMFDAPFNFANVIVLPLLLGLGIDSAIHYVMRARELQHSAVRQRDVTETSTPRAVLISALTTIGSFGTLWLSPHRGMSSMGELLTIAIIITLISTLIVLPQLIHWTVMRRT